MTVCECVEYLWGKANFLSFQSWRTGSSFESISSHEPLEKPTSGGVSKQQANDIINQGHLKLQTLYGNVWQIGKWSDPLFLIWMDERNWKFIDVWLQSSIMTVMRQSYQSSAPDLLSHIKPLYNHVRTYINMLLCLHVNMNIQTYSLLVTQSSTCYYFL